MDVIDCNQRDWFIANVALGVGTTLDKEKFGHLSIRIFLRYMSEPYHSTTRLTVLDNAIRNFLPKKALHPDVPIIGEFVRIVEEYEKREFAEARRPPTPTLSWWNRWRGKKTKSVNESAKTSPKEWSANQIGTLLKSISCPEWHGGSRWSTGGGKSFGIHLEREYNNSRVEINHNYDTLEHATTITVYEEDCEDIKDAFHKASPFLDALSAAGHKNIDLLRAALAIK